MKKIKKTKEPKDDLILPEPHFDRSALNYASDNNFSFGQEPREFKPNPVANKFSGELFKEEMALIPNKLIRIKHIYSSNNERWRIFEDQKNIFTLEGGKISKKEKEFLRSVEGAQFLLVQSKVGNLTVGGIKKEIKEKFNKKLSGKSKSKHR